MEATRSGEILEGFEERLAQLGGYRVRWFVAGAGEPLVLVHGLGGSALNWIELAPALARRHRVIVPDLPGHGGSAARPGLSRIGPLADCVARVLEDEEAAPAVLVGHSLGGLVSLRVALRAPDRVRGLVLAAPAGISSTRPSVGVAVSVLGALRPGHRAAPYRERIARSARLRRAAFGWWGVADATALSARAVRGLLAGWDLHTDTLGPARAMLRDDIRSELRNVSCPCLVLWGGGDRQVRVADGFQFARRLGAPIRVIADCGHLLIVERPGACLDAIETFAEGIRRGSVGR